MKKLSFAVAAAALLSLATLGTAAQAQPAGRFIQAQVYVVPAPPPPGYYRHSEPRRYYGPPPRHYHRDDRRHSDQRRGRWDNDRDGVPNRYDRDRDGDGVPNRYDHAPSNPYRR